mmetsp:Transcript_9151/g.18717  ORF Transcript_9151/g.18717 Transcript_9151/m.18717 type:complete len:139 (-) Transcript_9151:810-1226(-)
MSCIFRCAATRCAWSNVTTVDGLWLPGSSSFKPSRRKKKADKQKARDLKGKNAGKHSHNVVVHSPNRKRHCVTSGNVYATFSGTWKPLTGSGFRFDRSRNHRAVHVTAANQTYYHGDIPQQLSYLASTCLLRVSPARS